MKIYEQITPETWCQRSYAEDKDGRSVQSEAPEAVKWCAMGWLRKVYRYQNATYFDVVNHMHKEMGLHKYIGSWNDQPERKFEEVLELFKKVNI